MTDGINMDGPAPKFECRSRHVAGAQEVVLTTSGGLGDAETAGGCPHIIPRDGGNTFSGSSVAFGATDAMQGATTPRS